MRSVPSRLWVRVDSLTNNCSLHSNKTRFTFRRIRLKLTPIDSVAFSQCTLMCFMYSCYCLAGRDRFLNTSRFANTNCATIVATALFALAATFLFMLLKQGMCLKGNPGLNLCIMQIPCGYIYKVHVDLPLEMSARVPLFWWTKWRRSKHFIRWFLRFLAFESLVPNLNSIKWCFSYVFKQS